MPASAINAAAITAGFFCRGGGAKACRSGTSNEAGVTGAPPGVEIGTPVMPEIGLLPSSEIALTSEIGGIGAVDPSSVGPDPRALSLRCSVRSSASRIASLIAARRFSALSPTTLRTNAPSS